MKKILIILLIAFPYLIAAQEYETGKLETIAKIWGECYLFHPSVVRSDMEVNFEKQLIDYLPKLKQASSTEKFIEDINSHLLSVLNDPFTLVQSFQDQSEEIPVEMANNTLFDYVTLSNNLLSEMGTSALLDSLVKDKNSPKPLVLDCRIGSPLQLDWHTYTPFHYLSSMLIDREIPLSQFVTREHFGWDEQNDWWFYEQRWKIAQDNKQQKNNGKLMPFPSYREHLQQSIPDFDFENFNPIGRPLYFLVNNSFLSYYQPLLQALQSHRSNVYLIFENSGKVFTGHKGMKKYDFREFEFILNTSLSINNGHTDTPFGINYPTVLKEDIRNFITSNPKPYKSGNPFSFLISPKKYDYCESELSLEEKILGIIKVWTIVKYFYPYLDQCSVDWTNSLSSFLDLAQNTRSDKEYFYLVQEMMATLNDSHVSTYHPSILDFSNIFIAPVQFDWIENKVIVTAVDSSVEANIQIGDEIVTIDDVAIADLLTKEGRRISSSNRQGLLSVLINPKYFIGPSGSIIKFGIKSKGQVYSVELPRSMYVFQFMDYGDKRESSSVLDQNIGYLNLAALTNASELEAELIRMENTESLIIDLRNSYPTADYQRFLQMLCQNPVTTRQSEVPVISAAQENAWQYETSITNPSPAFSYNRPIVVLINKRMISRPEDLAIALRSFPNVRFVGEQTQGSDGEITKIHLPKGGETSFTGQIIKFGNGDIFQRKGIIPDIKVQRSVKGVKNNKDEILEKALEILSRETLNNPKKSD